MSDRIFREKILDAKVSAASGTAEIANIQSIQSASLDLFDEIQVYLDVNTALVGTSPKMDIYLQRAVVDVPVYATDAHWADFYAFPQVTTSPIERLINLFARRTTSVAISSASTLRQHAALTADTLNLGHWGKSIRVVEKMTGTVTTQAVYDLTLIGIIR